MTGPYTPSLLGLTCFAVIDLLCVMYSGVPRLHDPCGISWGACCHRRWSGCVRASRRCRYSIHTPYGTARHSTEEHRYSPVHRNQLNPCPYVLECALLPALHCTALHCTALHCTARRGGGGRERAPSCWRAASALSSELGAQPSLCCERPTPITDTSLTLCC